MEDDYHEAAERFNEIFALSLTGNVPQRLGQGVAAHVAPYYYTSRWTRGEQVIHPPSDAKSAGDARFGSSRLTTTLLVRLFSHYALATVSLTVASTLLQYIAGLGPASRVILKALVVDSVLASVIVYWTYRRSGIWPLFDNLRIPKYGVLVGFNGLVHVLTVAIAIWM